VFTSGRAALILSIPIGIFVFILSRTSIRVRGRSVLLGFLAVLLGSVVFWMFMSHFDLSIADTMNKVLDKLARGGGSARSDQATALLASISRQYGVGAGHGIGVDVVRSVDSPWRYELIWMATLHRVGVLGALVYAAPFLVYTLEASLALVQKRLPTHQRFLFGGFLAAFLASGTNPYIEGFALQWMFIIPMVEWYGSNARAGAWSGRTLGISGAF